MHNTFQTNDLVEDNEGDKGVVQAVEQAEDRTDGLTVVFVKLDCTDRTARYMPSELTNLSERVREAENLSGIHVSIYKDRGRSHANGGISDTHDEALLVLPQGGPFEPTEDCPAIRIEPGNLGGLKAVPVDQPEGQAGPMMGGSYVATSDSRFTEECARVLGGRAYGIGAVPLHDRFETWADYDTLSR